MNQKNTIIYVLIVLAVVAIIIFLSSRKSEAPVAPVQTGTEQNTNNNMDNTQQPAQDQNVAQQQVSTNDTQKEAVKTTVLKEGNGEVAKSGDTVSMNYTGKLLNGTTFDSNVDPKFGHVEPFSFTLGGGMVIKGWDTGIVGMKVGEKRKLEIRSDYAYGSLSPSPLIPANSDMVFEVELLGIKK